MYAFECFHYLCEPGVLGFPKLFPFLPLELDTFPPQSAGKYLKFILSAWRWQFPNLGRLECYAPTFVHLNKAQGMLH